MLLERWHVNPGTANRFDITPSIVAASNGYEVVVKVLLGCGDVNPQH